MSDDSSPIVGGTGYDGGYDGAPSPQGDGGPDATLHDGGNPSDAGDSGSPDAAPLVCSDAGTGRCLVVLAQGQANPVTAVVHGGFLYWLEEGLVGNLPGRIQRVPVAGGPVQVVAAGLGGTGPNDMTVDDVNVYWADEYVGLVFSAPNSGIPDGGSPTLLAAVDGGSPYSVSVDSSRIYWTDFNSGTIYAARLVPDGSGPTVLASAQPEAWDITNDGTTLYWTTNTQTGSVMALSLVDGGAPYPIVPLVDRPTRLAVSNGTVYFIANSANVVYSAPTTGITDGGAPAVLVTTGSDTSLDAGTVTTTSFAFDGTTVFWTTSGNPSGEVRSAPPGGTATTLAAGMTSPFSVVDDATNVYWVNEAFGGVYQMAK